MVDLAHFGSPQRCLGALGRHFGVSWGRMFGLQELSGGSRELLWAKHVPSGGPGGSVRETGWAKGALETEFGDAKGSA